MARNVLWSQIHILTALLQLMAVFLFMIQYHWWHLRRACSQRAISRSINSLKVVRCGSSYGVEDLQIVFMKQETRVVFGTRLGEKSFNRNF